MPWVEMPRATLLFEIHSQECLDAEENAVYRESRWLPKALEFYSDIPTLCHPSRTHLFPKGEDFPFDDVMAAVPCAYLENTIAYQLAYAIYEHKVLGRTIDRIGLFGVHMMGRLEFVWERPSVIYFIGLAQGMGIDVFMPPGAPLFMSGYMAGRYGLAGGYRSTSTISG